MLSYFYMEENCINIVDLCYELEINLYEKHFPYKNENDTIYTYSCALEGAPGSSGGTTGPSGGSSNFIEPIGQHNNTQDDLSKILLTGYETNLLTGRRGGAGRYIEIGKFELPKSIKGINPGDITETRS